MLSSKKKLQLVGAFTTLFLFAVVVGCNGFFVDPVLTSITVGPTATINQGAYSTGERHWNLQRRLHKNAQFRYAMEQQRLHDRYGKYFRIGNGRLARQRDDYRRISGDKRHIEYHG